MALVDLYCRQREYVYFDNLFTSVTLQDALADRGVGGCGFLKENRTEKAPLTDRNSFQKGGSGASESCFDEHFFVVCWNDNNHVTVATNFGVPTKVLHLSGM